MQSIIPFVLTCYCLPFFVTALAFSWDHEPQIVIVIAIFAQAIGGISLFAILKQREWQWHTLLQQAKKTVGLLPKDSLVKENGHFQEKINQLLQELKEQKHTYYQEAASYKKDLEQLSQQLEEEHLLLEQARKHSCEQEDKNNLLQNEIASLQFELRTLLKLDSSSQKKNSSCLLSNSSETKPPTLPPELDHCLELAKRVAEGKTPFPTTEAFAQHLFGLLSAEFGAPVFIYDQQTRKMFFLPSSCKALGWGREVLEADFFSLLHDSQKAQSALTSADLQFQKQPISFTTKWGTTQTAELYLISFSSTSFSSTPISTASFSHLTFGLVHLPSNTSQEPSPQISYKMP
jgi:hypothetical protein